MSRVLCAQCASVPHVPWTLRVLVPHTPGALCSLVPDTHYVPCALQVLISTFVLWCSYVTLEGLDRVIGKFLRNYFTITIASSATVALKIEILSFLSNVKHIRS